MVNELRARPRVCRVHDAIMDGLTDLLVRADGASVLDLGCNRGLAGYAMACNGARLVHGVDLAPDAVEIAKGLFADLVDCRGEFVVGDLTRGIECLAPFGNGQYDIIMMLATYHKIARPPSKPYVELGARGMDASELSDFITALGNRTTHYFAFRDKLEFFPQIEQAMAKAGLRSVHRNEMSQMGATGIWQRG